MRESIYNLIAKEEDKPAPPNRYCSQFKDGILRDWSSHRSACKTMGPANIVKPKPSEFLKKNVRCLRENRCHSTDPSDFDISRSSCEMSKNKSDQKSANHTRECLSSQRKPAVPKMSGMSRGSSSTKDFLKANKASILNSVPKRPKKIIIDTRHGHTMDLDCSGLEPKYMKKTDFGQVPGYLIQRQRHIDEALKRYNEFVKEMQERNALYQVTPEERKKLINGLKQRWQTLYRQYQTLSIMVDTQPKMNRKLFLENQLNMLEHDIEFLERFDTILVGS